MKTFLKIVIGVTLVSLILVSCTQTSGTPSPSLQTYVAQTISALSTSTALAPTATAGTPTAAPELPTFTPVPTLLPTATEILPTATSQPSLYVSNVQDLTPINSNLKGGQTFVKTWRITNGGYYAWPANYRIIFLSGDSMGLSSLTLGRVVNPGSTVEISGTFTAPVAAGHHVANFLMTTDNGLQFGMGQSADRPWSINITVENVFQVTAASITASPTSYDGACPATVKLTPSITVNGSGVVTYYLRFGSTTSDTYSLTFSGSGTQNGTSVNWPVTASGNITVNVYIDSPNHQDFAVLTIPVNCH